METVEISIETWKELKKNPIYSELIEEIEDREALLVSKSRNEGKNLKSWETYKQENDAS